jgi:hypothetical protein
MVKVMKLIDCSEAERLIVRDLDEGLDQSSNTRLENHLRTCRNCAQMRQEMRSVIDVARTDVPPSPDELFWKRYDNSLGALIREKGMEKPRGWRWQVVLPGLAAAMIVMAVVLFNADWHTPGDDQTASSSSMDIEELNQIFGPSPDELSPSMDNDMTVILSGATDDALVQWFEVEEEPSQTFL